MDLTLTPNEDIIKYLDDDLTNFDVIEFERKIQNERNLKNRLISIAVIDSCLRDPQLNDFRNIVKTSGIRYKSNIKKSQRKKYFRFLPDVRRYYKAASILFFVTISLSIIYLLSSPKHQTTKDLFSTYYQPYEENISTRALASPMSDFQQAIDAYKNKDYNKSIDYFNKVINFNNTVNFYKGIASIECNDYNIALFSLSQVVNDPTSPYNIQARWFMALIYLKLDQPKNAIPFLIWLKKNDSYYEPKASEILFKLQ